MTGRARRLAAIVCALAGLAAGALNPEPGPDRSQPQTQYGPDTQRTVAWFAASCDPAASQQRSHATYDGGTWNASG